MLRREALTIGRLTLDLAADPRPAGTRVLESILLLGSAALARLHDQLTAAGQSRGAAISRIRGTGPGASFGRLAADLERDHPVELGGPFEGSDAVTGAVWEGARLLGPQRREALLKLRFERGAVDLPLHMHERSDRFIVVLEGRGCFHVSGESPDRFTGLDVRNVPVRSRDAIMFTKGVVHTFSAPFEPLVLLSLHLPFVQLDDSDQYRVPGRPVLPRDLLAAEADARISCDPAWNVLACWPGL